MRSLTNSDPATNWACSRSMPLIGGSSEPTGTSTMSPISSTTIAVATSSLAMTTAGHAPCPPPATEPSPIIWAGSVTERISPRTLTTPSTNAGTHGTGVTS